jgi:hypothetical protein
MSSGDSGEYLTLKWGGLKSWNFESDKARKLLRKWADLGVSVSAMCHHDTPEQKQIICDLIDIGDFETVYLDWDSKEVSKEEAKKYVMEYGQAVTSAHPSVSQ